MALFRYVQVMTRRKLSYKHRYKILKYIGEFWLCIAVMVGIHWQFNSLERPNGESSQGQSIRTAIRNCSPLILPMNFVSPINKYSTSASMVTLLLALLCKPPHLLRRPTFVGN